MQLGKNGISHIIAGGPSAKGLDFSSLVGTGYILGVNDSGLLAPCDGVATMDRLWFENRVWDCKRKGLDIFVRHTVYDKWIEENEGWGKLHRVEMHFDKTHLSRQPFVCHGNNSGFNAFNYVVHHSPKKIFLYGFDFQGKKEAHWYPQYPWSTKTNGNHYRKWAAAMDDAYKICLEMGIEVYNCSNQSLIRNIPVVTFGEVLDAVR